MCKILMIYQESSCVCMCKSEIGQIEKKELYFDKIVYLSEKLIQRVVCINLGS